MKCSAPFLLCLAVLVGGCSSDTEPTVAASSTPSALATLETSTPMPTPTPIFLSSCANHEEVVTDESFREGAPLVADVDGDGTDDDAFFHLDKRAPVGCQGFLVVETATGGTLSAPVWERGNEGGLTVPGFHGAAEVNGDEGLELIVREIAGASTQFVGVFTVTDGTLERLRPSGILQPDLWAGAAEGLFGYGGSVGHLEAVDCTAEGGIVVTIATPVQNRKALKEGIYDFTSHHLTIDGAEMTLEGTDQTRSSINDLFEDYPEYSASPFGSCVS